MTTYIIRRLLLLPLLMLGISLIVFILIQLAPGDPISSQYGLKLAELDPTTVENLREELGLNDPIMVQYGRYLVRLMHGDLGQSLTSHTPVIKEITARYPATMELAITAMLMVIVVSIPLGVVAAIKRGSLTDNFLMAGALFGVSIPNFWFGIMMILIFGLWLGWLPISGRGDGPLFSRLEYLILPSFTLAIGMMGIVSRMVRSSVVEVLGLDYIRTAHAKGLRSQTVLTRHAIRNALIPVVTVLGLQFASLLGGAIIIETIFAWPGIGRLAVNAIWRRDYPVIMGTVLVFSFTFILANLFVDILYTILDPRIRYS
ncbi:MAG: ABC transporter permease [Chloroflexi bacterium]|nr:ABC transporter permease [Chloroflexota bacterium]